MLRLPTIQLDEFRVEPETDTLMLTTKPMTSPCVKHEIEGLGLS